jgi:beta-phosphoglucomutase-like phosphatase (HAD superfamily)
MRIGVGSSGTPEKIWNNLRTAGLADAFEVDHVVSATEVKHGKPAPDVYCKSLSACDS